MDPLNLLAVALAAATYATGVVLVAGYAWFAGSRTGPVEIIEGIGAGLIWPATLIANLLFDEDD